MKKFLLSFLLFVSLLLLGCGPSITQTDDPSSQEEISKTNLNQNNSHYQSKVSADKIQIYHFHGTNQCRTCVTLGELTQKTLDEFFEEELKSGKIIYQHINAELSENQALAQKYGVQNISLYINTIIGNSESYEEQVNLMRYLNNEEQFKKMLKEKLDGLLGK